MAEQWLSRITPGHRHSTGESKTRTARKVTTARLIRDSAMMAFGSSIPKAPGPCFSRVGGFFFGFFTPFGGARPDHEQVKRWITRGTDTRPRCPGAIFN